MVATDLYVLNQTAKRPAVAKREIDHWFDFDNFSVRDVQVIIGQGDIYVKLFDGTTAQRSYQAITTCHLCKLEASRPNPKSALSGRCALCVERKDRYHHLAEIRVRLVLRMGYQRMYGSFSIDGTAPFPFPETDSANQDILNEILSDRRADLDMFQPIVDDLKMKIITGFKRMAGHQRMVLIRKYGPSVFRSPPIGNTGGEVVDDVAKCGGGTLSLAEGRSLLRELQVDITIYRKVWAHMKRMGGMARRRGY